MDHGIDYRAQDLVAEVKRLTGGRGVNLVVDPVGSTTRAEPGVASPTAGASRSSAAPAAAR